jgi:hypothetical protein
MALSPCDEHAPPIFALPNFRLRNVGVGDAGYSDAPV